MLFLPASPCLIYICIEPQQDRRKSSEHKILVPQFTSGSCPALARLLKRELAFTKKDLAHILACVLRSIYLDTRWTQCSLLAVGGGIPGCHPVPSATRTSPLGQGAAGGGAYRLSDARFPAIFISGREVWIKRAMQRTLGSIM